MAAAGAAVAAIAGGGILGQAVAGAQVAGAQGRIAEAQLAEARRTRELALEAAEPSPEELAQMNRAVELNEQDIARKTKLLESSDPAIIESGRQALRLLQGEEARTLDPIKRRRQEQRDRLNDRLRAQLGSGFQNSSAGIQAISRFDQETDSLLAQEQDRSLGRLLGVAERTSQQQGLAGSVGRAGTLANLFGGPSRRRVAAIQGTPITPFAGAQFAGELQQARNIQGLIGGVTGAATTAVTLGSLLGPRSADVGARPQLGGAQPFTGGFEGGQFFNVA